jgi:hypothetical protein
MGATPPVARMHTARPAPFSLKILHFVSRRGPWVRREAKKNNYVGREWVQWDSFLLETQMYMFFLIPQDSHPHAHTLARRYPHSLSLAALPRSYLKLWSPRSTEHLKQFTSMNYDDD